MEGGVSSSKASASIFLLCFLCFLVSFFCRGSSSIVDQVPHVEAGPDEHDRGVITDTESEIDKREKRVAELAASVHLRERFGLGGNRLFSDIVDEPGVFITTLDGDVEADVSDIDEGVERVELVLGGSDFSGRGVKYSSLKRGGSTAIV
jgi:hypothetical protein